MTPEIFNQLLLATLLAVVSLIGFALRGLIQVGIDYLKKKVSRTEFEGLKAFADTMVKAIEQSPIYKDFAGDRKKEIVMAAITKFAEDHKLPITPELADQMIEAAVHEMNAQIGQIDWTMVGTIEPPKE